jgi:hypothetical protein
MTRLFRNTPTGDQHHREYTGPAGHSRCKTLVLTRGVDQLAQTSQVVATRTPTDRASARMAADTEARSFAAPPPNRRSYREVFSGNVR